MTTSTPQPVRLDSGANRSLGVAYAIWLILGIFGGHWYYLGRPWRGLLYTFTAGLFVVGWLVDSVRLQGAVRRINTIGVS